MPQAAIELGFNVETLSAEKRTIVQLLTEVYDAVNKLEKLGKNITPINIGGFGDLNKLATEQNNIFNKVNQTMSDYNSLQIQAAKAAEANAKAQKAITQSENEVIKQIDLETKAQQRLEQQANKTAKAKQSAAEIPFTDNTNVNNDAGRTSGTVVSADEVAATEAQLTAIRELNAEKQKSEAITTQASTAIQTEATNIERLSLALIEDKAALASNLAAQKEISGTTEDDLQAKSALVAEQFALKESIAATTVELKNSTREFLAQEGSINELRALVTGLRLDYDGLSEAERNTSGAQLQLAEINRLDTAVKQLEGDTGRFQKNVGNYPKGSTNALRAELQALEKEYNNLSAAQIKSQTGQSNLSAQNAIKSSLKEIETASVGSAGAIAKVGGEAFGFLRQAAYLIPGLGIAGIIGIISDGIIELIKKLDLGASKFSIVDETIKGTDESSKSLNQSLKALGDNANDIADGAFKKLDEATEKLKEDLGETPNAIDVAQGALMILQNELDKATKKYQQLNEAASVSSAGSGGLGNVALNEQLSQAQNAIDKTNKKIIEGNSKINENRIAQQKEALLGQGEVNRQFLEDNLKLNIDSNNKILSNDLKSFDERKTALSNNLEATLQINTVELNKEIQNAKDNETKKNQALEKFRYENLKAQQDYSNKLFDLQKSDNEKSFKNYSDSIKAEIEALQHVVENNNLNNYSDYKKRYEATAKITELQIYLSDATVAHEISNGKSRVVAAQESANRLVDIAQKNYDNIHKIELDKNKFQDNSPIPVPAIDRSAELQLEAQKRVNAELSQLVKNAGEDRSNIIAKQYSEEQTTANEAYAKGLLTRKQYEDETKRIAVESSKAIIETQIGITKALESFVPDKNSDAFRSLETQIARLKEELSALGVTAKEDLSKSFQDAFSDAVEGAENLVAAFKSIGDISFDNQKTELEEIGAQEDKNYEQQQNNIQNATLSDADRADQLKALDSAHAARQEEIARKQREADNKKAEFDKESAIANIILQTALAVVKALDNPFLAITVGILGAAQLAAAIATKVPHYGEGVMNVQHEHSALVGEKRMGAKYQSELVQRPGHVDIITTQPMILKLPKHSNVIPLSESLPNMLNKASMRGLVVNMTHSPATEFKDESMKAAKYMISEMRRMQPKVKRGMSFQDSMYIARNITHTA